MSNWELKMHVDDVIKLLTPEEKAQLPRDNIMDENDKYLLEQAVMKLPIYTTLRTQRKGGSRRRRRSRRHRRKSRRR